LATTTSLCVSAYISLTLLFLLCNRFLKYASHLETRDSARAYVEYGVKLEAEYINAHKGKHLIFHVVLSRRKLIVFALRAGTYPQTEKEVSNTFSYLHSSSLVHVRISAYLLLSSTTELRTCTVRPPRRLRQVPCLRILLVRLDELVLQLVLQRILSCRRPVKYSAILA
jgi:hypothetical protein